MSLLLGSYWIEPSITSEMVSQAVFVERYIQTENETCPSELCFGLFTNIFHKSPNLSESELVMPCLLPAM